MNLQTDREPDPGRAEGAIFVAHLAWDGRMVDIHPADGYSVSDMMDCNLSGPIGDILTANDPERMKRGEHLGFVYFEDPDTYDLRVF